MWIYYGNQNQMDLLLKSEPNEVQLSRDMITLIGWIKYKYTQECSNHSAVLANITSPPHTRPSVTPVNLNMMLKSE